MKTSNFKAIIREAVKEELRASLPKLLKENAVMESKKPPVRKSEFMEGISHAMNLQDQAKKTVVKDRKKYSCTRQTMPCGAGGTRVRSVLPPCVCARPPRQTACVT